ELGLLHVVRAGTSATHLRLGHLDQLQTLDAAQERARLLGDALRVREMTRRLIGDAEREPSERPAVAERREVLRNSAHLRREQRRALAPHRLVLKKMPVRLQLCAASSGVDDGRVDTGVLKRVEAALRG